MKSTKNYRDITERPGTLKVTSLLLLLGIFVFVFVMTTSFAYRAVSKNINEDEFEYALVEGNVERPGYHKVNPMTTQYELLAKAGLNDSSNVKEIQLEKSVKPNDRVKVGVSKKKAGKKSLVEYSFPRLSFYLGKTSVKRKLKATKAKINQALQREDLIFTRKNGKALIEFKNNAQLNMGNRTKVKLRKVYSEVNTSPTELAVISGTVFLKVPKLKQASTLNFLTSKAKIQVKKGNVQLSIKANKEKVQVFVLKGKAIVTRREDNQKIILEKNQQIVIKDIDEEEEEDEDEEDEESEEDEDEEGPQLVAETVKGKSKQTKKEFSDLKKGYKLHLKSQEEVSILLVSKGFNFVLSMVPKKRRIVMMDLPQNTYVGDYLDGLFRLDEAALVVGPEITREVIQRLIGRPIPYVVNVTYDNVFEFAYMLDGLMVEVDARAAAVLGKSPGLQRMSGDDIIKFVNPANPGGRGMAINRQKKVLIAMFRMFKKGGVNSYQRFFIPMIRSMSTNISPADGMSLYRTYNAVSRWQVMNTSMPSKTYMVGPTKLAKPQYDKIQFFYN